MSPQTRSKRLRGKPLEDRESFHEDEPLFQGWPVSNHSENIPPHVFIRVTRYAVDFIWPISRDIAFSALIRDIKAYGYSANSVILNMKIQGILGTHEFLTKEGKKIFLAIEEKIMLHNELVQLNKPPLPLISLNKRQFGATSDTASVEGSDCGYVEREFTKEEVEELLNKKFDHKGITQQLTTYHEDLKDCIKWYLKAEKDHPLQVERLRDLLNAAEKKCADTDELNAINSKLRQTIATLEEKLAKEESEKMDAIRSQRMEKEARAAAEKLQVALSGELEKVREEKLVVEQRAIKFEFDNNQTQEYSKSLQLYNRNLQIDHNTMNELWKQNEFLRWQLQEVRDDCDRHIKDIHDLKAEALKHVLQSDTSSLKIKDSEMAGSSASEITQNDRVVRELRARILELEQKIFEGERLRRKLHNDIQELKGNIRVFCRVRPLLRDDATAADVPVISYPTSTEGLGRGIDLVKSGQKYHFTFDKVFDHGASQQDVFVDISQLVQSALDGYKVCIFAYGQTGSGKTYTMMGRPETPDQMGLIPRSLDLIFQTILTQGREYKMQASVLEIYNDTIRDLLSTNQPSGAELTRTKSGVGKQYTIRHDVNGNTYISGLTIIDVCSKEEISSLLERATQSRSVGKTHMIEQSSRSHLVFTLQISWINENSKQKVQGVLNLIDLAGSERVSSSGATGDRLKETKAINSSLSFLGDVMSALANKEGHVPFRNSKLTHLLQPCLEGDSKTLMFVNVSPVPTSVEESLRSLQFAERVNTCELRARRRQTTAQP